ncbi:flavoprotein [Nocardia farcinica]|uniref:nitric oxide dioxygenase n=4 Tax=Nocardia TaxID=1817 RepID=Q5YNI6_NOCFA|nr:MULTISPECIES: FAD-binding oxidoreductase [Nocardia]AXK87351.1 flavoprotein [Nocardia farcinica]MBA4858924.1 flavoprotein [Nocardia farcinica]MBC9817089.1 flavoprotein [Nocardia farcinica]MBF6068917.1 flavoprotein [Nocardia farcinica]MBF6140763.1 flavoprotein [Nocardia farcinica]
MDARSAALVRANLREVIDSPHGPERLISAFYGHLFAENPGLRDLFPPAMDMQPKRLTTAIQFVLDHLEDWDRAQNFLEQLARDHRKYGVEAAHYDLAGRALLDAFRTYNGPAWTRELEEGWRDVGILISASMAIGANSDTSQPYWEATVVGHRRVLDDLAIVRLQSDTPVPYQAGQYVPVAVPQRPKMWRYFSPAIPSNPYGEIEFHVRKVRGGWVSPAIVNETQVGDRWLIGGPLGGLHVDRNSGKDVLMIGAGTGIAPLRAQLIEMSQRGVNPRVHFFIGGRYPCDLYDVENMWQLSQSNPWLTIVPVCEQKTNPWWYPHPATDAPYGMHRTLIGNLGAVVASFGAWEDRQIQIAGSAPMIADTRRALIAVGTPEHIITSDPI